MMGAIIADFSTLCAWADLGRGRCAAGWGAQRLSWHAILLHGAYFWAESRCGSCCRAARQRDDCGRCACRRGTGLSGDSTCAAGASSADRSVLDFRWHYGGFRHLHGNLPQPGLLRRLVRADAYGHGGHFFIGRRQFLGVATIVVYAGAILVTFLFVLMLAQPRGNAYYDRVSWEAVLAAGTGAALVGILSLTIGKLSLDQAAAQSQRR